MKDLDEIKFQINVVKYDIARYEKDIKINHEIYNEGAKFNIVKANKKYSLKILRLKRKLNKLNKQYDKACWKLQKK